MKTYQVEITEQERQVIMDALANFGSKGPADQNFTTLYHLILLFGRLK